MSDIVLKDKSGVKNTYNNINAINIPDGNGGFVKYSLGGTHLPEYDGTVIIEKADSVLGLRKWKSEVNSITSFHGSTSSDEIEEWSENNHYSITPTTIDMEGTSFTVSAFTPLFDYVNNGGEVIGNGFNCYIGNDTNGYMWIGLGTIEQVAEIIPSFNVISTTNTTVDEWLLANTEGVSE